MCLSKWSGEIFNIVWEGVADNVYAFESLKGVFAQLDEKYEIALHFVTDLSYLKYSGRFGKTYTSQIIKGLSKRVYLYEWNDLMCSEIICSSDLAIIPIDLKNPLVKGKPENKLLLFWRMGMPVITSATPSYERAMKKAGLDDSGARTAEFSKLTRILQEKLIHPSKRGRIHNIFLLTKSGIVIANLSTSNVKENDSDIMGGMFTAVKDFMEDAVSSGSNESLNDITFGEFHIKFASGAYTDMAVVYLGRLGQDAEDSVTDTLIAFELENMESLENWNGDKSLLKNSDKHLEDLFEKIDKSKRND